MLLTVGVPVGWLVGEEDGSNEWAADGFSDGDEDGPEECAIVGSSDGDSVRRKALICANRFAETPLRSSILLPALLSNLFCDPVSDKGGGPTTTKCN